MPVHTRFSHPADDTTAVSVKRMAFSRQQVFEAVANGALMLSTGVWPTRLEWDFREGGRYKCEWRMDTLIKGEGEFLEIIENEKVVFTWREPDGSFSTATLTLVDQGNFTKVAIVHTGLTDLNMTADVLGGWLEAFIALEEQLNGIRLRLDRSFHVAAEKVFQALVEGQLFKTCGA